jgi:hypothetical protein
MAIEGLDAGVVSGVTNANYKSLAERATMDMTSHHNRLQMIAESSVGQILNKMNGLDPAEAASIGGVVRSDLSKEVAALGAAVASIQQLMKGAQTTLPETGQG